MGPHNVQASPVARRAGGYFSGMKVLMNFFTSKVPVIADPKDLTKKELHQVTNYAREAYISISLLMICDCIIYINLIKFMVNNYAMYQDKYTITLPK